MRAKRRIGKPPSFRKVAALLTLVPIASCCFLVTAPDWAHASDRTTTASDRAKVHKLSIGKVYTHYDVTGDDKADRIVVKGAGTSSTLEGYYLYLRVYVNGKKRLAAPKHWDNRGVCPEVKLIEPKTGSPLIYIHYSTTNGYYAGGWVYRCSGTKYKCLLKSQKIVDTYAKTHAGAWRCYECLSAVKGNKLRFTVGSSTTKPITYIYRYRAGKLEQKG